MGSYVPNTSRRVLGILVFFWGGKSSASELPRVLFFQDFRLNIFFDHFFLAFLFFGSFSFFRHRALCPGEGNRRVFRPGAGNHRVFHPGEGNRRVFHPRSRKSPGFPPRCTGFSTQEQGTTGFSAQVHRVFHPGAPGFPPRRTENLSGGRVGWGETEDALTRLKTPEGSADIPTRI